MTTEDRTQLASDDQEYRTRVTLENGFALLLITSEDHPQGGSTVHLSVKGAGDCLRIGRSVAQMVQIVGTGLDAEPSSQSCEDIAARCCDTLRANGVGQSALNMLLVMAHSSVCKLRGKQAAAWDELLNLIRGEHDDCPAADSQVVIQVIQKTLLKAREEQRATSDARPHAEAS